MISTPWSARTALAAAAFGCLASAVAACGPATPAAAPPQTPATTPAATVPASPAAPSTPAGSTAPVAPAGPGSCPTRDLQLTAGVAQGTAGSSYQVLDFKNIGNSSCTLYGYPGVSQATGNPPATSVTQVGAAADEDSSTARELVTLAPGQVANAVLRIVDAGNFPANRCHPTSATYLQVYPPNQTTPIYLAYKSMACAKRATHVLSVTAVRPGAGSS